MPDYDYKVDESYRTYISTIHMEADKINNKNNVVSVTLEDNVLKISTKDKYNKKELEALQDIINSKGAKRETELPSAFLSVCNDLITIRSTNYIGVNNCTLKVKKEGYYLLDFSSVINASGDGRIFSFSFTLNDEPIGQENNICPKAFNEVSIFLKQLLMLKPGDVIGVAVKSKDNSTITLKYRTLTSLQVLN